MDKECICQEFFRSAYCSVHGIKKKDSLNEFNKYNVLNEKIKRLRNTRQITQDISEVLENILTLIKRNES